MKNVMAYSDSGIKNVIKSLFQQSRLHNAWMDS